MGADWDAATLGVEARTLWGKWDHENQTAMPLSRHLADTASVAGLLWDHWLPVNVRQVICGGLSDADGRVLLTWLAAAHDLGKATPAFAVQVENLADRLRDKGFQFPIRLDLRSRSPHSHESQAILNTWLVDQGFEPGVATAFSIVTGGHHGVAPVNHDINAADSPVQRGDDHWRRAQHELAEWLADHSGIRPVLASIMSSPPRPPAQVLLTATVIIADWIASDATRFPYHGGGTSGQRAEAAWRTLALTRPWRPRPEGGLDRLFQDRFDLPDGAAIRPVQRAMAEVARDAREPGLMVLEAPMGEGKTEAALLAAEILAEKFGLGGCFVALPTMATSDAMFHRVHQWIDHLPAGEVSIFLAHGKAALNPEYQNIARVSRMLDVTEGSDRRPVDDGCGAGVAVALEWLTGRKKGVLSSFVVGTIDQILVGALRSRHLALRHLAVAGKVVVIDEVHAADEYMSVYLERALHWLAAYRVPTVLLSATLTVARRDGFVEAYRSGWSDYVSGDKSPDGTATTQRAKSDSPIRGRRRPIESDGPAVPAAVVTALDYPILTTASGSGRAGRAVVPSARTSVIEVEFVDDDPELLVNLIRHALVDVGVVAVVRNTVVRAQQTAALLRAAFAEYGEDVVRLLHSRFLAPDRMSREQQLRSMLGPPEVARRPDGVMIVVGTQVLEQSLDVDFDLLITDLAPVDLVMQRTGRLHRHQRPPAQRGRMAAPRCIIAGVQDWHVEPPVPDDGSLFVYGRSLLLRSAHVLRQHIASTGAVRLPDDIAALVNKAYDPGLTVPDSWQEVFADAEQKAARLSESRRSSAETFLLAPVPPDNLFGWASTGVGDAESPAGRAKVRDGDDSLEVLVAQQCDGRRRLLPWIDRVGGSDLPIDDIPDRRLARALAQCSLRLPASMCTWRLPRVIDDLERNGSAAWQQSPWLRGQLVLYLDENLEADLAGVHLRYSRTDGLVTGDGAG